MADQDKRNWSGIKITMHPLPRLPIEAPPCPTCLYWNPQVTYYATWQGAVPECIKCCHAEQMHHDFSCFDPRCA